jgi:hypothetical protein
MGQKIVDVVVVYYCITPNTMSRDTSIQKISNGTRRFWRSSYQELLSSKYRSSVLVCKRLLLFTLANFELTNLFNQGCDVRIKHSECCLGSLQFASKVILDSERLEKGNKDELSCKTYFGMKFDAKHFLHCFPQQKFSSLPVFMMRSS